MDALPIDYRKSFLEDPASLFKELWEGLAWERRGSTPRREYYVNPNGRGYEYGKGVGRRLYMPGPSLPGLEAIWREAEAASGAKFDVCFLNGYEDGRDQLGWHADDSPEMDPKRPIAIVSLGAEREIRFKRIGEKGGGEALRLASGSLCLMEPGMQADWWHRIPKSDRPCGARVSLTFRGWTPGL